MVMYNGNAFAHHMSVFINALSITQNLKKLEQAIIEVLLQVTASLHNVFGLSTKVALFHLL